MSRLTEILLVLLLVVVGLSVIMQFQTLKLLNQIASQSADRQPVAVVPPTPTPGPVTPTPANGAQPANPTPANPGPTNPTEIIKPKPDPTPPTPTPPKPDPPKPGPGPGVPVAPSPPTIATGDPQWQTHSPLVETVIQQLLSGDYEAVFNTFDPVMQTNLSREALAGAIDPIRTKHGAFKKFIHHRVVTDNAQASMSTFEVDTELADGHKLRFTISIDGKSRVSGLLLGEVE